MGMGFDLPVAPTVSKESVPASGGKPPHQAMSSRIQMVFDMEAKRKGTDTDNVLDHGALAIRFEYVDADDTRIESQMTRKIDENVPDIVGGAMNEDDDGPAVPADGASGGECVEQDDLAPVEPTSLLG